MVVCGLTKKLECVQDWSYPASHSFEEKDSNKKIYEETLLKELSSAIILSYGTKGSGKTFTMFGDSTDEGMIQRSISSFGPGSKLSIMQVFKSGIYDVLKSLKEN